MEIEPEKITFFIKLKKGGKMKKQVKILKEGKKVVPKLKKVAKKATKGCRKSYPY